MSDFEDDVRIGAEHISYGRTYEMCFDGELGSLTSLDAKGHLDDLTVELFMATAVSEWIGDDEPNIFGIEVEHLWRKEYPFVPDTEDEDDEYESRWSFGYTENEIEGSIAVTRFSIASPWSFAALSPEGPQLERNRRTHEYDEEGVDYFPILCVNHPDEPAQSGVHQSQVINPPLVIRDYVYFCRPCSDRFHERLAEARKKALAELAG